MVKPSLPKKYTRATIRNAIVMWSKATANHPFTAIDLRNSGILDEASVSNWKKRKAKVPSGVHISTNSISAVCGSLEREGWLNLVHHAPYDKSGRCKQWQLNGSAIV